MSGPIVAVSGATAGFGREIARSFARNGAKLVLIGRRANRLDALVEEFGSDRALGLACDVRQPAEYAAALRGLPREFSEIDVMVNNAGIGLGRDPAQAANLQDWVAMVDTNVTGLIAGTQAVLPGMVARNRGHVVNISSIGAKFPTPGNAIYAASKAFMEQFALCLRADLLGTAVRVTTVAPGQAGGTEFSVVREGGDVERARGLYGANRLLSDRDVAEAVEWAVGRPPHVNVTLIQLMPVDQAFGPMAWANE